MSELHYIRKHTCKNTMSKSHSVGWVMRILSESTGDTHRLVHKSQPYVVSVFGLHPSVAWRKVKIWAIPLTTFIWVNYNITLLPHRHAVEGNFIKCNLILDQT